jgi:hypothetical protein
MRATPSETCRIIRRAKTLEFRRNPAEEKVGEVTLMGLGQAKLTLRMIALVAAFGLVLPSSPIEAREKKYSKREVEKFIPEGEYDLNGRHVASGKKSVSRKPARAKAKAHTRAKPRARVVGSSRSRKTLHSPSRRRSIASKPTHSSKSAKKKKRSNARSVARTKKRTSGRDRRRSFAKKPSSRIPYARPTSNERDMPFVSIPKSRVRKDPKTIEMTDPAVAAKADPEGPSQHEFRTSDWPGESAPAAAPSLAREAPSVPAVDAPPVAGAGTPEPDAFDLHSGSDPMRGQGPVPAAESVVAPAAVPAIAPIERPAAQ